MKKSEQKMERFGRSGRTIGYDHTDFNMVHAGREDAGCKRRVIYEHGGAYYEATGWLPDNTKRWSYSDESVNLPVRFYNWMEEHSGRDDWHNLTTEQLFQEFLKTL